MATEKSKAELSKGARIARSATTITMVALVALMAWYQFGGADHSILASLKGNVISLVNSAREAVTSQGEGEKLSTPGEESFSAEAASTPWEVGVAQEGESVWGVYKEMIADKEVDFRNQTVNGLKNITVVQNNIPIDHLAASSLILGQEYSVLSEEAATTYAGKVKEANEKLQDGVLMNDLSPDVQLAYQLANAPSYEFLYSLSVDNIHSVYE